MVFSFQSGYIWTIFGAVAYGSGHVAIYLPQYLYDITIFLFFPINFLINIIAQHIIGSDDYTLNPLIGVGSKQLGVQEDLVALKKHIMEKNTTALSNHQLISLFDTLPVATTSQMFGYWSGTIVRSNSLLDLVDMTLCKLSYLGFAWGKRYRSPYIGDPLMLSWMNVIHVPIIVWGNVQLNDIEYRGKVNATMVYDHQPWQDYFRILDDGTETGKVVILGIWASRQKIGGWFTLTTNTDMNEAIMPHHRLHTTKDYINNSNHHHVIMSEQAHPSVASQLATAAQKHPIHSNKKG